MNKCVFAILSAYLENFVFNAKVNYLTGSVSPPYGSMSWVLGNVDLIIINENDDKGVNGRIYGINVYSGKWIKHK